VLPRASTARTAYAWSGFRPRSPDRLPIIDRIPRISNAWFTSGHFGTGILMAAATGVALAEWIATGSQPRRVTPFALDRFN
jgi:D-amino-acid dehydrogenase